MKLSIMLSLLIATSQFRCSGKKMSSTQRLRVNESFLRYLHNANIKQRKQLLKSASKAEIESLCECAFNILRKNVKLKPQHLSQLRKPRNKRLVYQLADKSVPISKKRKQLVTQSGGFPFALLVPIIASALGALL